MITEKTLKELGFEEPIEHDTTWSYELDKSECEGVYGYDKIFIEVDTEIDILNFHYLHNGDWKVKDCIMTFFPNINTDEKLIQFINLITE